MGIVQLANFVSPTSGGIRTTLDRLRHGYRMAGHDTALVIPGPLSHAERDADGVVVQVAAPRLPRSGGYRMVVDLRTVHRVLEDLRPDRIEVNDRFTLRAIGTWAQQRGIPSLVVVHERLDRLSALHLPWLLRTAPTVRRDNRALGRRFDAVVSPSSWAAEEFRQAGVDAEVVGWGVDADCFRPDRRDAVLRRRLLGDQSVLLVMVCRLSPEKRPELAIEALRTLRDRGVDARLVVAGTGQAGTRMSRQASGLPVTFLGHLHGRDHVAELLAAGDVAICPGPVETFGLAALEALASGTPVVSSRAGAVPELLDEPYGLAAYGHGPAMATAAQQLLEAGPVARDAARAAAEAHPWSAAIDHMLALHGLEPAAATRARPGCVGSPASGASRTTHLGGATDRVVPDQGMPDQVVRPMAPADIGAVRELFTATAALGRPLDLPASLLEAYADLCLGWYTDIDGSACGVLVQAGHVTGYALVALDDAAHARWLRRRALRWAGGALAQMAVRPTGTGAGFTRRRLLDGAVTVARGVPPPMPAHLHLNVGGSRRGARAGFLLAGHADAVVGGAGLPGYHGEVNIAVARPGRRLALERLGVRVVHRQRNRTLSWLAGEPVDRLTVVRSLDPADGWTPLPHTNADHAVAAPRHTSASPGHDVVVVGEYVGADGVRALDRS